MRAKLDLRNCDCMELMRDLEDKSQHLIICDPPYFRVKGEFDFIWKTFDDYLKDVEKWAIEIKRILADNGTLFWWGDEKKIAYTQIILDKYFNLINSLVWWKGEDGQFGQSGSKIARSFATSTERLLMYSNDDKTGHEIILETYIKTKNPFSLYLKSEFKKANLSYTNFRKFIVNNLKLNGGMASHWLKGNCIISKDIYKKIRNFLNNKFLLKEYEDLLKEYKYLLKEYEELRKEYEELRRPFNNYMKLTDVIKIPRFNSNFDHPTQKAPKICRVLISTCSKKGQNMFIPFVGSGTEMVEGYNLGLNVIGSELDKKYYELAKERIKKETMQLQLF